MHIPKPATIPRSRFTWETGRDWRKLRREWRRAALGKGGKVATEVNCADCGGWDIEWMHRRSTHNVEFCRSCECPYCAEEGDDFDEDWGYEYDEDPPLYAAGRIAAMTDAELIAEANRQCLKHDQAVDRCEEINSPTIETAAARLGICSAECKRRVIEWLDLGDDSGSQQHNSATEKNSG